MQVSPIKLIKGLATYLPGITALTLRKTGGTVSARYCYSVWMRHLVQAGQSGEISRIVELGPGDSLGIGLAALLSGVNHYHALDVKNYSDSAKNMAILDQLVGLFKDRASIPDDNEFPLLLPRLPSYDFPYSLLNNDTLEWALSKKRVRAIREALRTLSRSGIITVEYTSPWDQTVAIEQGSIDLVFSQAVMEHAEDVEFIYSSAFQWLRPGGLMSHTIDFKCHSSTRDWNGHWSIPDFLWKIIVGNRPFMINRRPHSWHITSLERNGFKIISDLRCEKTPIPRQHLARKFKGLSDCDLKTSEAFIQAIKPFL